MSDMHMLLYGLFEIFMMNFISVACLRTGRCGRTSHCWDHSTSS